MWFPFLSDFSCFSQWLNVMKTLFLPNVLITILHSWPTNHRLSAFCLRDNGQHKQQLMKLKLKQKQERPLELSFCVFFSLLLWSNDEQNLQELKIWINAMEKCPGFDTCLRYIFNLQNSMVTSFHGNGTQKKFSLLGMNYDRWRSVANKTLNQQKKKRKRINGHQNKWQHRNGIKKRKKKWHSTCACYNANTFICYIKLIHRNVVEISFFHICSLNLMKNFVWHSIWNLVCMCVSPLSPLLKSKFTRMSPLFMYWSVHSFSFHAFKKNEYAKKNLLEFVEDKRENVEKSERLIWKLYNIKVRWNEHATIYEKYTNSRWRCILL